MNNPKNLRIVVIIGALIAIGVFLFLQFSNSNSSNPDTPASDRGVEGTPLDVTLDFYQNWLEARNSTTTDPYTEDLPNAQALHRDVSQIILNAENSFREHGADPVLCGTTVPKKIKAKPIFEQSDSAQILIRSTNEANLSQIVVTLASHDALWEITAIDCNVSEQAPDTGEFNFDTEGYLLKDSLTASFNKEYWHIVFEQNGVPGHTAPLQLTDTSVCTLSNGSEETCSDAVLFEAAHVRVRGNMTEAGATVGRIDFIE